MNSGKDDLCSARALSVATSHLLLAYMEVGCCSMGVDILFLDVKVIPADIYSIFCTSMCFSNSHRENQFHLFVYLLQSMMILGSAKAHRLKDQTRVLVAA